MQLLTEQELRNYIQTIICLITLILLTACNSRPKVIKNQNIGPALGTSYSIIYLSDKELDFQQEIDSVFLAVNQSMSTYIPNSDISKINSGDTTVVVGTMFKEVFELSAEVKQKTNGYFDPTVGVLVNAWGFGPGAAIKMDSVRVDSLMKYVGLEKVRIDKNNKVVKEMHNIYIDFNAIAKGYAIDRLAKLMDAKGIQDYLLEVGGEVVAKGENRIKNKQWTIGIDNPQIEEGRKLKLLIYMKNRALASSGNYRKFRVDPETHKKYVHTIDPKTGFTKNSNTLAVNILANTCAEADAYATAFMAMDLDDVLAMVAQENNLEAYIIYLDKNGEVKEFMTDGFKSVVLK